MVRFSQQNLKKGLEQWHKLEDIVQLKTTNLS